MATLYYNAVVDNNWDTLGNWWQDATFFTPAVSLPTTGDTVYLEGSLYTGPTVAITVAALYLSQYVNYVVMGSEGAGITITGDLIVGKSSYLTAEIDPGVHLTVGGMAYFNGSSYNLGTLVAALTVFNSTSFNGATIDGDAVFNWGATNGGIVTGNAIFNDYGVNYGSIAGDVDFNGATFNYSFGLIGGDAIFNDQSTNSGTISGNADVYYPVSRPLGSTVAGVISYHGYPGYYFNAAVDNAWDNLLNWWSDDAFTVPAANLPPDNSRVYIEGDIVTGPSVAVSLLSLSIAQINSGVTLGDAGAGILVVTDLVVGMTGASYGYIQAATLYIQGRALFYGSQGGNSGTLNVPNAYFYDQTSNYGTSQGAPSNGIVNGTIELAGTARNYSTINGQVTFRGTSYNASGGTVNGFSIFYDSSYNASGGSLTQSAYFYDNTYNAGSVLSAEFNSTSRNASGGVVTQAAHFYSSSYNASGGTVGDATTFSHSSYNNGLVSGDATVNSPVVRPLGGTVSGTITYVGYPPVATLYFKGTNGNWNDAANWWKNNTFQTSAGRIPYFGDTVYIEANVTTGPSSLLILAAMFVAQINTGVTLGSAGAGITITGNLTVGLGIYRYGRIDGANLAIGGTAYFYGGNGGNSSTLTVSRAYFNLGSSNYGTAQGSATNGNITGYAFFRDNTRNYCTIGSEASFYDASGNGSGGTITGEGLFNDSTNNASGATAGNHSVFRNYSTNNGTISGDADVYYPVVRPIDGTVTGTTSYYNYP